MVGVDAGGGVMGAVPGRAGCQPVPGRDSTRSLDDLVTEGVAVRVGRVRRAEFEGLAAAGWDVVTVSLLDRLRTRLRGWSR